MDEPGAFRVVNGRLVRTRTSKPHERSVSSLHDTKGHGILPSPPRRASDMPWMTLPALKPSPRDAAAAKEADAAVGSHASPGAPSPRHGPSSLPPSPRKVLLVHKPAYDNMGSPIEEASSVYQAGPEQVVYRSYSRPSNRTEAIQLSEALAAQLEATQHDARSAEGCWGSAFRELVRQVYVHCAERGELLERVRLWHETELKRLRTVERKAREREKKLREQLRAGGGFDHAAEMVDEARGSGTAQRVELLQAMQQVVGAAGMGALLAEATARVEPGERQQMLAELLPAMAPLPAESLAHLLAHADAAEAHGTASLMGALLQRLPEEQRGEALAATLEGAGGVVPRLLDTLRAAIAARGGVEGVTLGQQLVAGLTQALPPSALGGAIGQMLGGESAEHTASVLQDLLSVQPEGGGVKLLKELLEHLSAAELPALLTGLVKDMAPADRASVLGALATVLSAEDAGGLMRGVLMQLQKRSSAAASSAPAADAPPPPAPPAEGGGGAPSAAAAAAGGGAEGAAEGAGAAAEGGGAPPPAAPPAAPAGGVLSFLGPEALHALLAQLGTAQLETLPVHALHGLGLKLILSSDDERRKGWAKQLLSQLKATAKPSELSQLMVAALSPEVGQTLALMYTDASLDDRTRALRGIYEQKTLGQVSPAPFSPSEVQLLCSLLGLHDPDPTGDARAADDGAAWRLAGKRAGALAAFQQENLQVTPLEQTLRTIAEIYSKKIKEDAANDARKRPRVPLLKFVREYLMRQYGMKSMAEKAMRELSFTIKSYSESEDVLARVRLFGDALGMLRDGRGQMHTQGMTQGMTQGWADRKVNFMLLLLQRLGRPRDAEGSFKDPASSLQRNSRRRTSIAAPAAPPPDGLKELLTAVQSAVSLPHALAAAEQLVVDSELKEKIATTLREAAEENRGGALDGSLSLDAVLGAMVGLWDEQMAAAALQTEALLHEMFTKADQDRNGRMSFSEFEQLCSSLRHTTFEDNVLLDIYDEAIRLTESICGEESDSVSPEAFARVARAHEMLPPVNVEKFADAIALSMQEQAQAEDGPTLQLGWTEVGARGGARVLGKGAPKRERMRRTVIKGSAKSMGGADKHERKEAGTDKPERVHDVIRTAVRSNFLFRHLNDAMLRELVLQMVPISVAPGQAVIRQGDKGDYFYVAERGAYDVLVDDVKVHTYVASPEERAYPCFGELALLYAKPRAASVVASEEGALWGLDRRGFRSVQMFSTGVDLTKLLRKMDILSSLPFNALQLLMNAMQEVTFHGGEYVFRHGDQGDSMYVIMRGNAVVTKPKASSEEEDDDEEDEIMQLEEQMYFGERALLDNAPRAASVRAITPLECMCIGRELFEKLLGPLQHIIDADRQRREREAALQQMQLEAAGLTGATHSSFRVEAPIVRLDSGGLLAVQHLGTSRSYTVRAEAKVKLLDLEQTERELAILRRISAVGHLPMLPACLCTFASPVALFALFKARIACELSFFLEQGPIGPEVHEERRACAVAFLTRQVRFVAACVTVALEKLHDGLGAARGAVYRNLTPDALTVDENGIICLMDFRLAKGLSGGEKTFTLCGTADYLSPEQVTCSGHTFATDLWSLGVLLWEVSAGEGPWGPCDADNEMAIYKKITAHSRGGLKTGGFDGALGGLLDALLVPEAEGRLGAGEGGFGALREHAYFENAQWTMLAEGAMESPLSKAAVLHMRSQLNAGGQRPNDSALSELVGTTEYTGESNWFKDY